MADIFVQCPRTGTPISTGLKTEWVLLKSLPRVPIPVRCPACGQMHKWDSHLCICPQAGQRTGIGTRGRLLRRTHSVLRPVEIGVPVRGHLTNMSATCDPLGERTNIRRPVTSATFVHTTLPWARSCALNMGAGTTVSAVRNFPTEMPQAMWMKIIEASSLACSLYQIVDSKPAQPALWLRTAANQKGGAWCKGSTTSASARPT